ncbi:ADP-ribosylglycohydrolase family protein [Mailhella massiliensis]|uniref:ADP-ribosylglycohydrolase family protein n=1 Tax=Mailhella massiliensis TaxID=1903261 RepID=A0A921AWU3_9BACT|nr:ADP-ribosylglycohydrolase family protein [Mailhella massiliensis]HJD97381.1 ADP-ribosylglycohydrolase family protein [Mailhella massiliensis]
MNHSKEPSSPALDKNDAEAAPRPIPAAVRSRARGCMLGQLSGDSLGSLVEFRSPEQIRAAYPHGVRELADGGTFHTLAGQPTDDSEMALAMARQIATLGRYCALRTGKQYRDWLKSHPFDCGNTIARALRGEPNPASQANGALMRISPMGIFGAGRPRADVMKWAKKDAALTHTHPICGQANALYAALIAHAVAEGGTGQECYAALLGWMKRMKLEDALRRAVENAAHEAPHDYMSQMGWVLIALQNALWQMLHAPSLEEGVVDTVMRGGDTDTNAAIAGALLGAIYGEDAVPAQWREAVLSCRPEKGREGVTQPRPELYWPVDAVELADALLEAGWK